MGLVRQLIAEAINATQRPADGAPPPAAAATADQPAVGTKDVARDSHDLDYKHEAAAPYAAPAPPAEMGRHGRDRKRDRGQLKKGGLSSMLRPLKGYEDEGPCCLIKLPLRYFNACGMAKSQDKRRSQSLDVAQGLAYSLIVVGAIFLGLTASGNFMGSVEDMKYVGTFAPAIAKYSVYIFAGLTGVVGALLTRRACAAGTSFRPAVIILLVAAAAVLASLGLGGYQISKAAELHSAWWTYLISALMIVQRILYLVMLGYLLYTMKEASEDASIREQMLSRQRAHEAAKYGTAPPADKGAALV